MNRRTTIKTALAAGAALPSIVKAGANNRLNVAFIGVGNIGKMAFTELENENWVALCDVDQTYIDAAKAEHPQAAGAKTFRDFRVMFDKLGREIDAVCVSTPDHTHFVASMWALEQGKHVCTQKPLTYTIWEARALRQAAAKQKGLVTNMANQGHTYDGIRQVREWLECGLIGDVGQVHAWEKGPTWGNSWFDKSPVYPPAEEPVPASLEWDLWLGPLADRPFSSYYHPKKWRSMWETGTGMLGDWFCHTCDGPVWALGLYDPDYVELVSKGGNNHTAIIPDRSVIKWHFAARDGKPPCDLYWHDGELVPSIPDRWSWGKLPERGSFFMGTENTLYLDERSNNPRLANRDDMIEFKKTGYPPEKYPRIRQKGPFAEWAAAIKGEAATPGSNFDYAARLTEVALLGVLAQRFGGRIDWDSCKGRITNREQLNDYVRRPVRAGWEVGQQYTLEG